MVGLSTDEKPRFTLPPPPPPPPLLFGLLLSLVEADFGWAVVVVVVFLGGGAELLLESGSSLLEQQPMVPRFYAATKEEIAIFCRRKFDRKQQVTGLLPEKIKEMKSTSCSPLQLRSRISLSARAASAT